MIAALNWIDERGRRAPRPLRSLGAAFISYNARTGSVFRGMRGGEAAPAEWGDIRCAAGDLWGMTARERACYNDTWCENSFSHPSLRESLPARRRHPPALVAVIDESKTTTCVIHARVETSLQCSTLLMR